MSDIKEAVDQIKRELKQYTNEKTEAEAALIHARAEIEYLEPQLSKLRAEVYDLNQTKNAKAKEAAVEHEKHQKFEQQLNDIEQAIATGQIKLEDIALEQQTARENFDKLLLDYEFTKRQEVAESLRDIEGRRNDLNNELKIKQDQLEQVTMQLSSEITELESFRRKADLDKKTLSEAVNYYADRNVAMEVKNNQLKRDNEVLQDRQTELRSTNADLKQKYDLFQTYEQKAWIALNAKDEALQNREADLASRENLRPPKSFLPPLAS